MIISIRKQLHESASEQLTGDADIAPQPNQAMKVSDSHLAGSIIVSTFTNVVMETIASASPSA